MTAVDAPEEQSAEPDALEEAYAYQDEAERPWRARRPALPGAISVIVRASVACAVLAGALVAYALWVSAVPQARTQEELYGQLREELAQAVAPLGGDIEPGAPVALLEVPTIGLRQVVVEGTGSTQLWAGPGHRRDTPLPGQPGISHVYGHAAAFGAPFRSVLRLRTGEPIVVTTGQGQFTYHVIGVRRAHDPRPPLPAQGKGQLTLVTAEGTGWRAGWAPDKVVYVDALMEGETQLPIPGRPTTIADAEKPMQGDPDALIPLVLWLQILAAAALLATWARIRWGGAQTWVVGVPILLAGLWGFLESAAQLLPNLG